MPNYLTVEDILAIHAHQIDTYGGSHGIRDPGLLEAALFRKTLHLKPWIEVHWVFD